MSDTIENIVIAVQAQGADAVIAQLKEMGQSGQQAAQSVAQAMVGAGNSATDLKNKITILTDAILNGEKNIAEYTAELNEFTSAELAATAGAVKMAAAEADAAASIALAQKAAATGATSLKEYNENLKATSSSFSNIKGILATVGGLFALTEIKKAADEYTTLSNQLKQVTTDQDNFNTVLGRLSKTANTSQSDIGAVVKLYYNLAQSTRDLKLPQDELLKAVDAINLGLYANGVQGTNASRVLKDFSEILSGAGNASRLFNSIQQQAPGFLADVANSLGKTTEQLRQTGSGHTAAAKPAKDYTQTLADQRVHLDNARSGLDKLNASLVSGTLSGRSLTQATQLQRDKVAQLDASTRTYQDTRDKATEADKRAVSALTSSGDGVKNFVEGLSNLQLKEQAIAATMSGTFGGAFTVLNNNFVLLVGSVDRATGGLGFLRDGIIAVANHLDIIIPVIAAFIAAWALNAVIKLVTDLSLVITTKLVPALVEAGAAFVTALGPWGLAITGIAAVVLGLAYKFGLLDPALDAIKEHGGAAFDTLTSKATAAAHATDGLTDATKRLTSAEQAEQDAKKGDLNVLQPRFAQDNLNPYNTAPAGQWPGSGTSGSSSGFDQPITFSSGNQPILTQETTSAGFRTIQSPGGAGFISVFASGGQFQVPGAGPVDSQYVHFMATPGEMVTIHTPQQAANNNIPHFRSGGTIGIDQGLQGVNVSFGASTTNSVTGYAPIALPIPPAQASAISNGSMPISSASTAIAKATTVTVNGTQFTANGIPTSELQQASANAQTKYDNDRYEFEYDKNDLNPFVFWPSPGPGLPSGMNGALMQLQMDAAAGAVPWSPDRLAYEKSTHNNFMRALQPGSVTGGAGGLGQDVFAPYAAQDAATNAKLHPGPSVTSYGAITVGAITYVPAPGQSYHLRDGGDMYVDGAGAVDSRYVGLNVSPGESVHVRTPAQRAAANSNGGTNITQNFNITTKDMSDVRASSKQLGQDAAAKAARAMRRSGLG